MGESLVKRHQLALLGPVVAFGKDGHRAAKLEASIHVAVQGPVAVALADDRYVTPCGPDEPPLELAGDEDRRVGQEVEVRLDREKGGKGGRVEPGQGGWIG